MSTDDFTISGGTVYGQAFILVEQDSRLDYLVTDGVLGLGFKELSDYNPTLVENAITYNEDTSLIFSIYFPNIN